MARQSMRGAPVFMRDLDERMQQEMMRNWIANPTRYGLSRVEVARFIQEIKKGGRDIKIGTYVKTPEFWV